MLMSQVHTPGCGLFFIASPAGGAGQPAVVATAG